jgi:hypothetical protein
MARRPWTTEEDAILDALYPDASRRQELFDRLPDRTWPAIQLRARRRGLLCRPPRWSAEDDAYLTRAWLFGEGMRAICERLGRRRSAVHRRAWELGLDRGIPQGCLSIEAMARRECVTPRLLRRVLRAAGVQTNRVRGIRHAPPRFRRHYVEIDAAREALAAHYARLRGRETLRSAAMARGIHPETFRLWLLADGAIKTGRKSVPSYVSSADADRVVAARREGLARWRESRRRAA